MMAATLLGSSTAAHSLPMGWNTLKVPAESPCLLKSVKCFPKSRQQQHRFSRGPFGQGPKRAIFRPETIQEEEDLDCESLLEEIRRAKEATKKARRETQKFKELTAEDTNTTTPIELQGLQQKIDALVFDRESKSRHSSQMIQRTLQEHKDLEMKIQIQQQRTFDDRSSCCELLAQTISSTEEEIKDLEAQLKSLKDMPLVEDETLAAYSKVSHELETKLRSEMRLRNELDDHRRRLELWDQVATFRANRVPEIIAKRTAIDIECLAFGEEQLQAAKASLDEAGQKSAQASESAWAAFHRREYSLRVRNVSHASPVLAAWAYIAISWWRS